MSKNISSVCYHYIKRNDEFSRIWGHTEELFRSHIDFLKNNFNIVSIEDIGDLLKGGLCDNRLLVLLTFDDGLKEHLHIGRFLSELGLKAVFNICSDIIIKKVPVTAQVLHFGTAYFGVRSFAKLIKNYIDNDYIKNEYDNILEQVDHIDPVALNSLIKNFFNKSKYHYEVLKIMRRFWDSEIERVSPKAFERIFLNADDVKELLKLGHSIGLHTASHISFHYNHNESEINDEIITAKKNFEQILGSEIRVFAYPFGKKEDEIPADKEHIFKEVGFDYVLKTYNDNIKEFRPMSFGRYLSQSTDLVDQLKSNIWFYEIGNNNK